MRRFQQITDNQVKSLSVLLSLLTSAFCVLSLSYGNNLYRVGKLLQGPVHLLCLAGELARHRLYTRFLNKNAAEMVITKESLHSRRKPATKLRELVKSLAIITISIFAFGFLIIAQGGPVANHYLETASLATLLTILAVFPIVQFLGVPNAVQVFRSDNDLGFINRLDAAYLEVCQVNAAGVIFGAWAASIAYPLDWDRAWQAYPIPNVIGAVGGLAAASCFQLLKISGNALKVKVNRSLGID